VQLDKQPKKLLSSLTKNGKSPGSAQSSKVSLLSLLLVGVREVRFWLRFSRLGAIGDKLLEVQRDFLEDRFEAASGDGCRQEPTADLSLDLVDGHGTNQQTRRPEKSRDREAMSSPHAPVRSVSPPAPGEPWSA